MKIILYAYSRGVVSSREIAGCCRENVIFIALSADRATHFTAIADFVSSSGEEITVLFRNMLLVCDELGLIGCGKRKVNAQWLLYCIVHNIGGIHHYAPGLA